MKDGKCLKCSHPLSWHDDKGFCDVADCPTCHGTGKAPESPEALLHDIFGNGEQLGYEPTKPGDFPEPEATELDEPTPMNDKSGDELTATHKDVMMAFGAGYKLKLHYCRAVIDPNKRVVDFYGVKAAPRPQENMSDAVDQDVSAVSGEAPESPETSKQPAGADVSAQQNAGELEMTNPNQEGEQ